MNLYENMKSMVQLVDRLRDFHLQDYISLPRITVLGEQSSGKSSLLESIAGVSFLPRGTGIVTRRPLELRMIKKEVPKEYFTFPDDFGEKQFKSEEVTSVIEKLTEKVVGGNKNISNNPIICRIYSPTVPNLTLIDLPGLTRNAVGDQPENIDVLIKEMVTFYCSNVDTLILCVVPANIDLANSDALNLAQKLDPKGERTLGVLTKIDLMDEGTSASKTLQNQQIKLKYGYVGIKGRSNKDNQEGLNIEQSIKKELDFFTKHPVYSSLPSHLYGTISLIQRVSELIHKIIQKNMPKIQREIKIKKKACEKKLNDLGVKFPEQEEDKLETIFQMIRDIKHKYDQSINGKFHNQEIDQSMCYMFQDSFKELFKEYTEKGYTVTKELSDQQIMRSIEVYQGENIPGFQSFDSFLALINPQLDKIQVPVISLLEDIKRIMEEQGFSLIDKIFKNFAVLKEKTKEIFNDLLKEKQNICQKILRQIVKNEQNYIFTNDSLMLSVQLTNKELTFDQIRIQQLRQRLDNYFFIIIRNLRNQIPKVIGKYLIYNFNEKFEVEILNKLNKNNYYLESLKENNRVKSDREKLKAEYITLKKAEDLLISDFGMEVDDIMIMESVEIQDIQYDVNLELLQDEFIKYNQQFMDQEKKRLMKEFGLIGDGQGGGRQQQRQNNGVRQQQQNNGGRQQQLQQNNGVRQQQVQQQQNNGVRQQQQNTIRQSKQRNGNNNQQQQQRNIVNNKQRNINNQQQQPTNQKQTYQQQSNKRIPQNRTTNFNNPNPQQSNRKPQNFNNQQQQSPQQYNNQPKQFVRQNSRLKNQRTNQNNNVQIKPKSKTNNLFGEISSKKPKNDFKFQNPTKNSKKKQKNNFIDFFQFNF